jgi:hypothetical protein
MNEAIQRLQEELADTLRKTDKKRRLLGISRIICYGSVLIYFLGIVFLTTFPGLHSLWMHDYEQNPSPTFWEANRILVFIIPLFVLIIIGTTGIGYFFGRFAEAERHSVRHIVKQMFPEAKCYIEPREVPSSWLTSCCFFGKQPESGHAFGTILFEQNGQKLNIQDIVVHQRPSRGILTETAPGGMIMVFRIVLSGLFGKRIENTTASFRGLFAHARLAKAIQGSVVILPDHLERHLDYLAQTVQSMRNISGNRAVYLEDIEFERRFAVYATDEITARYILTPGMMRRMTELQKKYNRDLMLSFHGDSFFFAVSMPEGFLTLEGGSTASGSGRRVGDLYDSVETARIVLQELKLDKAPGNEIRL